MIPTDAARTRFEKTCASPRTAPICRASLQIAFPGNYLVVVTVIIAVSTQAQRVAGFGQAKRVLETAG